MAFLYAEVGYSGAEINNIHQPETLGNLKEHSRQRRVTAFRGGAVCCRATALS